MYIYISQEQETIHIVFFVLLVWYRIVSHSEWGTTSPPSSYTQHTYDDMYINIIYIPYMQIYLLRKYLYMYDDGVGG